MAARKKPKCENLVILFDEIEKTHQSICMDVQKALEIRNDPAAVRRLLQRIKEKLQ